jgi:hypothetical protein
MSDYLLVSNNEVNDSPTKTKKLVIEVGGKKWVDMPHECLQPLNGCFPYREWALKLPTGDTW